MSLTKQQLQTRITELNASLRDLDVVDAVFDQILNRMYPANRVRGSKQERPGRSQFNNARERVDVMRKKFVDKKIKYTEQLDGARFELPKLPEIS